jgi:hypothetical protein
MRGLSAKCWEMGFSRNYFVEEKPVDQVHESVDRADPIHHGPAAIATCASSPELSLWPLRCLRAPTKGQGRKREARGTRFRAHQGAEGDDATMVKAAVEERLTCSCSRRGQRGRRGGGGAVGGADAGVPFYRVRGGARRLGIGEERAVNVVRHNGDEGGHFGRGSTGE